MPHRLRLAGLVLSIVACVAGCAPVLAGGAIPAQAAPAKASWGEARARAIVEVLAGEEMLGRGSHQQGTRLARDYLVEHFKQLGLAPAFEDGYTQPFSIAGNLRVVRRELRLTDSAGKTALEFRGGQAFKVLGCSEGGQVTGQAAFVGYATSSKDREFDSFGPSADSGLRGKVAVALRYEPHDEEGVSRWTRKEGDWTGASEIRSKIAWAQKHGAAALVIVNPPAHAFTTLPGPNSLTGRRGVKIPVLMARASVLSRIANRLGKDPKSYVAALKKQADAGAGVIDLGGMSLQVDLKLVRKGGTSWNVAARLDGAGDLAAETVIVGAHYDHLGYRDSDKGRQIFYGADDNASGTAAVLMLAGRMHKLYGGADAPDQRRAIVFVLFGAEEIGLVGSRHLAGHLNEMSAPAQRVQAVLNFDMVGRLRGNTVRVFAGSSRQWGPIIKRAADGSPLGVAEVSSRFGMSDHASFTRKHIPALMFFTGKHDDYHRFTDTPDKINYAGMAQVVDLAEAILVETATMGKRLQWSDGQASAGGGAYLGVTCDAGFADGCKIRSVQAGAPAAEAGLETGDVIIGWNEQEIGSMSDLVKLVRQAKPGVTVALRVRRGEQELSVEVLPAEK